MLNFPNHFCLASWISNGTRIPSFIGETYPLPPTDDAWAEHHLAAQAQRVDPYPETLDAAFDDAATAAPAATGPRTNGATRRPSTAPRREYLAVPYEEKDAAKQLGARWDPSAQRWYIPAGDDPAPFARWRTQAQDRDEQAGTQAPASPNGNGHRPSRTDRTAENVLPARAGAGPAGRPDATRPRVRHQRRRPPKREVHVDYEPPPEPPKLDDSPVRRVVGRRVPGAPARRPAAHPRPTACGSSRSLTASTRSAPPSSTRGAANLPRLYDEDYAILALLDRAGLVPRTLIGERACPGEPPTPSLARLVKLYRHGLIAQHPIGLREHTTQQTASPPLLYSLTRRGMDVAQKREPPAISRRREWRPIEQGRGAAPRARPARARLGHSTAPPRRRHRDRSLAHPALRHRPLPGTPGRHRARPPPDHAQRDPGPRRAGDHRPRAQAVRRDQARPRRSSCESQSLDLSFDLLVELDLTAGPPTTTTSSLAYDAFLCGWSLAHPPLPNPRHPPRGRVRLRRRHAPRSPWHRRPTRR